MNTVNTHILIDCLDSISFYDIDCCEHILINIDPTDSRELKALIKYRMYLNFCMESSEYKELFKQTLKYCLNLEDFDFAEIAFSAYASLPIGLTDYKLFFVWIWEVFYEHEDYTMSEEERSHYTVENNTKKIQEFKR